MTRRPAPGSRAAASEELILRASRRLFLAHGYDGVNLDRVAEEAGVARQTVYNRFGSKDAVFRSTVERHWARLAVGDGSQWFDRGPRADAPRDVLRRIAEDVRGFIEDADQVAFTRMVIAESRRLPWIAADFHRAGKEPLVQALTASMTAMTQANRLTCSDPELAGRQFLGLIQEFLLWPHVMRFDPLVARTRPDDEIVAEAIQTFLCRFEAGGR